MSVSDAGGTYTGSPFPATATVTGVSDPGGTEPRGRDPIAELLRRDVHERGAGVGPVRAIRGTGPCGRLYGAGGLRRQHRLCRRRRVDGLHDRPGHAGGHLESSGRDRLRHVPEHVAARRFGGCRGRLSVLAGRGYPAGCRRPDAVGHVHADRHDGFHHGPGDHHDPGRSQRRRPSASSTTAECTTALLSPPRRSSRGSAARRARASKGSAPR